MSVDNSSLQAITKFAYPLTDAQSAQIRETLVWTKVDEREDIHTARSYYGQFTLGRTEYSFCVDVRVDDDRERLPRVRFNQPIAPVAKRNAIEGLILQLFKRGIDKQAQATDDELRQIQLTEQLLPTVGILYGEYRDTRWSGSCFKLNDQHMVMTCAHCVDQDMNSSVEGIKLWVSFSEVDFWQARLVAINYELDVAVLQCIKPTAKPEWLEI